MTFNTSIHRRVRSGSVALIIIFIGAAGSLAVPAGAHAAPAATTRTGSAVLRDRLDSDWFDSGRQRVADPIADQAAIALMLLRQAKQTMLSADVETYSVQRNLVAAAVADRLGLDGQAMKEAWATADVEHQEALLAGLTQLGVPYRRNTSKPGEGFDCSGLTTYAWGEAGFTLTRQSSAQIRQASPRTFETAQAGDLMQYPGHVMMWLGVERAILHASDPGHPIEVGDGPNRRNVRIGDPTG